MAMLKTNYKGADGESVGILIRDGDHGWVRFVAPWEMQPESRMTDLGDIPVDFSLRPLLKAHGMAGRLPMLERDCAMARVVVLAKLGFTVLL